jgi:hypothetical protein
MVTGCRLIQILFLLSLITAAASKGAEVFRCICEEQLDGTNYRVSKQ